MKFLKLFTLIVLILLNSCVSVKNSNTSLQVDKIKKDDFNSILGTYKNIPYDAHESIDEMSSLWRILDYKNNKINNNDWKNLNVTFVITKNRMFAELRNQNLLLQSKEIKGEINNGFYLLKNQYRFKTMFIYLINGFGQSSVKLTTKESNLVVLEKIQGIGLIGIIPGFASGGNLRVYEFEKIK